MFIFDVLNLTHIIYSMCMFWFSRTVIMNKVISYESMHIYSWFLKKPYFFIVQIHLFYPQKAIYFIRLATT